MGKVKVGQEVRTGITIRGICFAGSWRKLNIENFKKAWKKGDNEKNTGLSAEKAAAKFGIKPQN